MDILPVINSTSCVYSLHDIKEPTGKIFAISYEVDDIIDIENINDFKIKTVEKNTIGVEIINDKRRKKPDKRNKLF
jgi:hypothetical protein